MPETIAYSGTFFPSDFVDKLPSVYQVKSGLFKGIEEMWEKWGIFFFFCLFASMDGGHRKIRDKSGKAESRTVSKGEVGRFKKGNIN